MNLHWNIILFVSGLIVLTFGNNISKPLTNKGNEVNRSFYETNSSRVNSEPVVFDDFILIDGLEIIDFNQKRFIQLAENSNKGRAENYFFEASAKFDITLFYNDELNSNSAVEVTINDRNIGSLKFGLSNSYKQKTLAGINLQQWSKIVLEFHGDGHCRIEKLVFTPVGVFDGKPDRLAKPVTLKIFETTKDQMKGRQMFSDFVSIHADSLMAERQLELSGLKNPAQWKEKQQKTRKQLSLFLGEFPEKTALNAKIVGKIDREAYIIEKVIFESQPKYFVTANLYIPKGRRFPLPGVLFTCGHSDEGKAQNLYHETCLGLVMKGYIVLSYDPMGQGERSEYIDNLTKNPLVHVGVNQHHYLGRPSFLTDWTLAGLRTWDGIRAVDYLVSRIEVDKNKLAVVGNSGGGQMTLLITAVDERIKVCAAAHPGGSMEQTYLIGRDLIDREIFSLIPPRPVRLIVGRDSGEEPGHRKKHEDMLLFNNGLGYNSDRCDFVLVDGVHNMEKPKREAAYEWLNKWFDKEEEGKAEAVLKPEKPEDLWCTESGNTLISLGSETGQSLNVKRAGMIYKPESDANRLKERITKRTGLTIPQNRKVPELYSSDTFTHDDISLEKLSYESEKGIIIPSLLLKPKKIKPGNPVYICFSDKGKPQSFKDSYLPILLAKKGFIVFAIDVRGIGETSPSPELGLNRFTGYTVLQWQQDVLAIRSAGFGRTTLGMRAFDVIRGIDYLTSRKDMDGRKVIMVGEGLGGLWGLLAAVYDSRIKGVVTLGTLPSYKQLISSQYYNVWGYFWVPGALRDFDIPDLVGLVSPTPQIWINPVNALGETFDFQGISSIIGSTENLKIITPEHDNTEGIPELLIRTFQ